MIKKNNMTLRASVMFLPVLIFLVIVLGACEKDQLLGPPPLVAPPGCSGSAFKFAADIKPILDNSCVGCHNGSTASGGVNLSGYDNVKPYAQSGELESSILPGGKMAQYVSDCDVYKIRVWIQSGAANN